MSIVVPCIVAINPLFCALSQGYETYMEQPYNMLQKISNAYIYTECKY